MTERRRWEFNRSRLRKQWTDIQKAEVFTRDFDKETGGVRCALPTCHTLITEKDLKFVDLHHLTKLGVVGTNFTENKKLAHGSCNGTLGHPDFVASLQPEEREQESATPIPRILGSQSEKSPQMVEAYEDCIRDRDPWRRPDDSFEDEVSLEQLLSLMPTMLGSWVTDPDTGERRLVKLGVSESYRKYVLTDAASGRLFIHKKGGKWWVRYVGELKEGQRIAPAKIATVIPNTDNQTPTTA